MISQALRFALVLAGAVGFSSLAHAQCASGNSVIPGLPGDGLFPCEDPYTPNTPSDPSDGPNAAGSPNEPKHVYDACDADFMNQIYARSYLEANRDVMISELLIAKPDSVLEYSCFDQQVKNTAEIAGPIFSESPLWSSSGGGAYTTVSNPGDSDITINVFMGDTKLDQSLNQVVMASLDNFASENFAHEFLNNTSGDGGDITAATVAAAGTACAHMDAVYDLVRCENINPATFFMTFAEIAANDPRDTLTGGLQCGATNPITTAGINVANNNAGTYSFNDPITTYYDNYVWRASGSFSCSDPIPTGLIVTQETFNYSPTGVVTSGTTREFASYMCPNPGCYYDPGTLTSPGTCEESP